MTKILDAQEFIYNGNDLGAVYSKENTIFKVWAPTIDKISVIIYESFDDYLGKKHEMIKVEKGVWELELIGNHKNKYYNYLVLNDGIERETPDIYTKGASANGEKGMIIDFPSINPYNWENHKRPAAINRTESIIYEIHIRDFSSSEYSGMKNKGKYLAFTEENTKTPIDVITGLDHLKDLGITHVHLLPVFDFASVDENTEEYNWGYDPYLYNVPEGSYATDAHDGTVRIREFKTMVQALHENGINVIMDVVYNHTFTKINSPMDILVPKYYYRTDDYGNYTNGSGCGNEIASEKPMVRKFIVDSIKFWAQEYKIDGFRFDLMALEDISTMKEIENQAKSINSNIIIYGEPWTGGSSSLPQNMQMKKGTQKGTQVSVFNDDLRNALKGDSDGASLGFVNGGKGFELEIKKGIVGGIQYNNDICNFTQNPGESINYVSAHDNLCLYDKFEKSNPHNTPFEREKMNRLALSIVLTSQGVPFIQGGTEILSTKQGNHNSYNAGDMINKISWNRKFVFSGTYEYIKGLITLRKSQKVLTLDNENDVRKSLKFLDSPYNSVAYELTSTFTGNYDNLLIIHNANNNEIKFIIPDNDEWIIIANEFEVNVLGVCRGDKTCQSEIIVPAISSIILCK
ncbi:type I pullulanase [Clostridium estertheticum]|uniref:Type I pullulanase n=1 Tax=Clostridium estertheticum TaxID=238834 RepID=A0A5N7J1Q9_9CLOT|nr:type I pullulanase [Clostridium estertheticum]MBU3074416.1 type I pullulanase [Clostridium estertheticum]MBU3164510.1 type I pullulanase [Clostridium estertheticum]MBU3184518.1 type I pullulanase [Clostridium estertheticum]MPQ31963.1 type I pullulanase [Clostridium estertheticum]MPQ62622.1 type I pullulanase [Clostridium estertheticum]